MRRVVAHASFRAFPPASRRGGAWRGRVSSLVGFFSLFLFVMTAFPPPRAEAAVLVEDWEKDLQYDARLRIYELIRALDAPMAYREEHVEALVAACHGERRELVLEMIRDAFPHENMQIREGLVAVLARVGDPRTLPDLERRLRFDSFLDVRIRILRALPAFLLVDDARLHREAMDQIEADNFRLTERVRAALRAPPLRTLGGEYDPVRDQLRLTVARILATQLDPVAAAIEGLGSKRTQREALEALLFFTGDPLADTQEEWTEIWKAKRRDFVSPHQEEMETLRVWTCRILAAMGAETTPEIEAGMREILLSGGERAVVAALDALATLSTLARERTHRHRAALLLLEGRAGKEREVAWRRRALEAAGRTLALAAEGGGLHLESGTRLIRAAAYETLGACRSVRAVEAFRRRLVQGREALPMQIHMARALGEIGGEEAVSLLALLATFRSETLRRSEQREAFLLLRSAYAALAAIAGRADDPGRTPAFERLLAGLEDTRPIPGGPPGKENRPLTLQDLALLFLQELVGKRIRSTDPAVWREAYETHLASAPLS